MTKAFDTQDLLARAKAQALPLAEKDLKILVDSVVLPWLKDSLLAEATTNPVYAIGIPLLDALQVPLDAELAKLLPDAAV